MHEAVNQRQRQWQCDQRRPDMTVRQSAADQRQCAMVELGNVMEKVVARYLSGARSRSWYYRIEESVKNLFLRNKREEWHRYISEVHSWERDQYLEKY